MKRLFISSVVCFLLCLTPFLTSVSAQESKVDLTKCITLTVKECQKIKLDFAEPSAVVWVKVTGVKDEKKEKASVNLTVSKGYESIATTIKVYGAIEMFSCSNNDENLTGIALSLSTSLKSLSCSFNNLLNLSFDDAVNLTDVACSYAQLV